VGVASAIHTVTNVRSAEATEPIEVPFGMLTRVGPANLVLGGDPYVPPGDGAIWGEDISRPSLKCGVAALALQNG